MLNLEESSTILANYIKSLSDFQLTESDLPYDHMGATITDGVLQAGIDYKNVVKPRVEKTLTYGEASTTSGFFKLLKRSDPSIFLDWHGRKVGCILDVCELFINEKIEDETQLKTWLSNELNCNKLHSIFGIGDKTLDYFKILSGLESIAVDRWLKDFLEKAGIKVSTYSKRKEIIRETAKKLKVSESLLDHSMWKYASEKKKSRKCSNP